MIETTIADTGAPSTREMRGLKLYQEHGEEIRFDARERVWLVPSQSEGTSVYEVTLGGRGEACECADFEHRGAACKHIVAATIAKAKTARCSGCGGRFPRPALTEVHAEHQVFGHEILEGQRYCHPCARRHGVL